MAKRNTPEGARSLSELLDDREQWKKEVGRAALVARTSSGQSQADVAEELDITQPYLSLIENGHRTPSDRVLEALRNLTEGARNGDSDKK